MPPLFPEIEETDVQTVLKGKMSGELAGPMATYTQAPRRWSSRLTQYRDSLEELAHIVQRCAR